MKTMHTFHQMYNVSYTCFNRENIFLSSTVENNGKQYNETPILYIISLTNEDFGQICDALQECESFFFCMPSRTNDNDVLPSQAFIEMFKYQAKM